MCKNKKLFFFKPKFMSKYYEHATTFLSFDAIKNGILYNDFGFASRTNVNLLSVTTVVPKVKRTTTAVVTELKSNKDLLLVLQNNSKIMNIMTYYRRQRYSLSYIYVEANSYIVAVIKKPTDFPLVVIRIPIDNTFNYANGEDKCYEFPIHQIQLKNIKYTKNTSYSMMYKSNKNDKNIDFVYTIYNKDGQVTNTVTISDIKVGSIDIINNLLKTEIVTIPKEISYKNQFLKMNIIILKEIADLNNIINFINKNDKEKKYFELNEDKLLFVTEINRKSEAKELVRKEEAYVWNNFDSDIKMFELKSYDNLFKSGFSKSFNQNDKTYYVFANYLGEYFFIKLVTSLLIEKEAIAYGTFDKIFNKDHQLLECYLCSLIKSH